MGDMYGITNLQRLWTHLIFKLREERGDVGDFTKEELSILGEDEEEEYVPSDDSDATDDQVETTGYGEEEVLEGDKDEEEEEGEPEGEDEPSEEEESGEEEEIPKVQRRINELVGKAGEAERKLELYKTLGPEGYYKMYPAEKPEEFKGAEPAVSRHQGKVLSFTEAANMKVIGGAYDGQTLAEVKAENPEDALDLYLDWRDQQKEIINQTRVKDESLKQEVDKELTDFGNNLAKDLFGKKARDELDNTQTKKVESIISGILDWMQETDRFNYKLEDAYFILNKDDLINGAKGQAVSAMISKLKENSGPVVEAKKGSSQAKTGYEAAENMSSDELAEKISTMADSEFERFRKNAPQSLKVKFPSMAWD